MLPKPRHFWPDYAVWFRDQGIVDAYHHRPPYPQEAIDTLAALVVDEPRAVLDVGCGTGDIARRLVDAVDHVDAVDFSLPMLEKGKRLPGGDHPALRWIYSAVEEAPLTPPYALITAGESVHWMDWERVFPRFADVLTPRGVVAIVERDWEGSPAVRDRLRPLFRRYAVNRDWRPTDLIAELTLRGLYRQEGERQTAPVPWRPTVEEYIECRHSQNGLSRERMAPKEVEAFDRALRDLLDDLQRQGTITAHDGRLDLEVDARVVWGKPCP